MSHSLELIGRVVGEASPEKFTFVVPKDKHPPKYEYIVISSQELVRGSIRKVSVLAQVVGVVSRSTVYSEDLDYRAVERIHSVGIDYANVLCLAKTLGFMINENGRKVILMPRRAIYPGNPVYLAPDELVEEFFSYPEEEGLHIGYLVSRPRIKVHLSVNGFRRHVAIIAQTGAGKSYTVGVLLEELLKKGATAMVIDPHADYVFLSRKRDGSRYEYWDRIQVFRNPNSTGRYSSRDIDNLKELTFRFSELDPEDIARIAGISERYTNIRRAISKAIDMLREDESKGGTYGLGDLLDTLEKMSEEGGDRAMGAAAMRAIAYVSRLKKFKVFGDRTTSINDIVKPFNVSVIDLSGLNDASQDYIVSRVLEGIMNLRTSGDFRWPVFVFIEEAHKFIPNKSSGKRTLSAPIINSIAAEGRKFGVFLTLITQRPSKVDSDSLSQCNSQIILKITNPKDQSAVQEASERLGSDLMNDLPGLNVGEAIIMGELTRVPIMVRIRERITAEGGGDIDLVQELKRAREELKIPVELKVAAPRDSLFSEV